MGLPVSSKSRWLLCATVVFCLVASVSAQTDRAGVVGKIVDPSGAVLPGVEVVVINVGTGPVFETVTMDDGRYVVPQILKPGTYRVEASLTGFKKAVSSEFLLQIGDIKEISLKLEVGQIAEQVTVISEATQLETETSSVGEVIVGRQVTELPLKDRNFTQLATLVPGVTRVFTGILTDQTVFNQGDPNAGSAPGGSNPVGSTEAARFSRSGGAAISANGLRPTNNNFSLDGVDNNEPQFGTIGVFPNPDAIQEFKVETSVPRAEVGRAGGAVINTTFKSGTNDLHGSVYYYGQNDRLNATHAIINRNRANNPSLRKSIIRVNEFGFTVGGPIIKNRTFFFGDYLGQRNKIPVPFQTAVPTAKSRAGDFSEFDGAVNDPLTGKPFPNNIIPNLQSRSDFSPVSFKYLGVFPLPTKNVRNPGFGNPNFFGVRQNEEEIDSFDIKIDHRLTETNTLMGRFSESEQTRRRANYFKGLPTAGFGAGDEIGDTRQIVVSDVHVFRPTLINEFRFGYTRIDIGIFNSGVGGAQGADPDFCKNLGIPNCNKGTLETTGSILTGGFGTGEFEFLGDGGLFRVRSDNLYFADSLTVIKGTHTIKTGLELRPRFLDTIDGGRSGGLKGHLQWAAGTALSTGNAQGDYLLNVSAVQAFSGTIVGGGPFDVRNNEWGLYVQDDWKAADNLTLNLGLRYDLLAAPTEGDGRMANYLVKEGRLVKASGPGDSLIESDDLNFGPRVGFAYAFGPERKMVLRGGYGLLYALDGYDYPPLVRNPPITSSVSFSEFAGNRGKFTLQTGGPVAPIVDPPVIRPETVLFFQEPDPTTSEIHQWNLTTQWEFARDWLIDLGYVGTRATHLLATRNLGNNGNGLGFARTPDGQPINDVNAYENRADSWYHGLQTMLLKRFSRGFEMRIAYTWSHAIDTSTGVFQSIGEERGNFGGPINPLNFRLDRGSSSMDVRHLFSSNLIWDLPFAKGLTGASAAVLDGWQVNLILSGRTGQPFDVVADSPGGRTRADLVGDPFANVPAGKFLNPRAFGSAKSSVTNLAGKKVFFGNLGRNVFTGPGWFRTDFSLFKNFAVREGVRVQFGMEFFNLFNHNDPVVPNQFVGNPAENRFEGNFGVFDNALPPRTIQYRLKILF